MVAFDMALLLLSVRTFSVNGSLLNKMFSAACHISDNVEIYHLNVLVLNIIERSSCSSRWGESPYLFDK